MFLDFLKQDRALRILISLKLEITRCPIYLCLILFFKSLLLKRKQFLPQVLYFESAFRNKRNAFSRKNSHLVIAYTARFYVFDPVNAVEHFTCWKIETAQITAIPLYNSWLVLFNFSLLGDDICEA